MALIDHFFARAIKRGEFTVIHADGTARSFGAPDPEIAPVTIRFTDSSVARRILIAARQLQSAANGGRALLAQDLEAFERQADGVRAAANDLRNYQTRRRPLERSINRTRDAIVGVAAAAIALGGLLCLISH